MDDQLINTLLGQGLAILLVVGGLIWGWRELWPYLRQRDIEQRERHAELESSYVATMIAAAESQVTFARVMENLCHRITVEPAGQNDRPLPVE
jgi:hypothetical protein